MDILSLGFTATRRGLTSQQKSSVGQLIKILRPTEAHHGGCVGGDADCHNLLLLFATDCTIYIHPSDIKGTQAELNQGRIIRYPPKPPLIRNLDIVLASKIFIACPKGFNEELRSGTWSTIRRARDRSLPRLIVWPSGTMSEEHSGAIKFILGLQAKRFTKTSDIKAYSAGDVLFNKHKELNVIDVVSTLPATSSLIYVYDKSRDLVFTEDERILAKEYARLREGT